jgi:hypothetical protein
MEVNQELSLKFKGRRYRTPDGRIIAISHVNQIDGPMGSYLTAYYNADKPDVGGTTRAGSCRLDYLDDLVEVK